MGVEGLLKFLAPIVQRQHLSSLRSQRAAVDIMSWIYKGCYVKSEAILDDSESVAYLEYVGQMLDLLQHYQIEATCVFDGRFVGGKQATVDKRRALREANRKKGQQLAASGQQQEANKYLSRCITVNEQVIATTMRMLKGRNVPFLVAPYEADAQIAKLFQLALVDFAICQDSDLVIYGVPVALKLSGEGDCDFLDISSAQRLRVESEWVRVFAGMSKEKRTEVAVLAGSDYLPSVKGIGIKKSLKYLSQFGSIHEAIQQITQSEKFKPHVPQNYEINALKAKSIFMLATSYNLTTKRLEYLNPHYLQQITYDQLPDHSVQELVGPHYGYDQEASQGLKNVWNFEKRDLSPLAYHPTATANWRALVEREESFRNGRVARAANQRAYELSIQAQQEVAMICQSKQLALRHHKTAQVKHAFEKHYDLDLQKLSALDELKFRALNEQKYRQKQQEAKERFGDWVQYCPI